MYKIKSLEAEKSDLEVTVDNLERQIMQLMEILPDGIEQVSRVYAFIYNIVYFYVSLHCSYSAPILEVLFLFWRKKR